MNYLKLYVKICRKSMSNDILPNIYYEKHHIFPESIYGKNNLIVHLTARTHYIVHLLLWKALRKRYGSNHSNTRKMAMAFHWMIYGKGDTKREPCHKSYLYDIARISASESKLGKPRIDMLGKKYFGADDETIRLGIEKMRIKKTGKKIDNYPANRKSQPCSNEKAKKISESRLKTNEKYVNMSNEEFDEWKSKQKPLRKDGRKNPNITRAEVSRM